MPYRVAAGVLEHLLPIDAVLCSNRHHDQLARYR